MADEQQDVGLVPLSEFLGASAAPMSPQQPEKDRVVPLDVFMGGKADEYSSGRVFEPLTEEHKHGFMASMGLHLYAGLLTGQADLNRLIGYLATPVTTFLPEKVREWGDQYFVQNQLAEARNIYQKNHSDNPVAQFSYDFAQSLGRMGVTLPVDIMTGGAIKAWMAGKVLPVVEALAAKIPGFALGSGWRGLVDGMSKSDNPLVGVAQGMAEAGENVTINTLYARAGEGFPGIMKMTALGGAEAVYDAAKEGRMATPEEIAKGSANGMAFGAMFAMFPAIREASQIGVEKVALGKYEAQLRQNIADGRLTRDEKDPQKKGSVEETLEALFADERIRPQVKEALLIPVHDPLKTTRDSIIPPELDLGNWKDRSALLLSLNTAERNIERVAGGQATEVKSFMTDKIKANETYRAEWLTKTRAYIRQEMDRLGIKVGSEESKFVQRFGEGKTTLQELQQKFPTKYQNIVEASKIFREQYDQLLDTINSVSKNFGLDPIKKLDNYFRHFQDMGESFLELGFMHSPKTAEAGIPNRTKPKKPFTSVEIERKGNQTKEDALAGFDNWLDAAANRIFHTDSVQRVRALENYIRKQAEANEKIDLANYVTNLRMYGDILAGKSTTFDQGFRDLFGRRAYGIMRFLDKRVSKNMILYNASSALMNFVPFTQSISTMDPRASARGVFEATITPFNRHAYTVDGVKSDFYARRYPAQKLAINNWEKAEQAGGLAFSIIDQFAVKSIIAGKYYEGRAQGLEKKEAMQKADDYAERLVTDRSWGQLPVAFETKSLGVLTRFQVEVTNMAAWVTQDLPQEYKGQVGKLVFASAMFALNSYLFNEVMEKVLGRRPTIDPIYALATVAGVAKSGVDKELGERLLQAGKDFGGQLPFGNLLVEGGRFPVLAGVPNIWKMVGDPGRNLFPELAKPVMYGMIPNVGRIPLSMPFGGGQIKKTLEGMADFARSESLTPAGETRYGIEQDFTNFMRGFLFGRSAYPEAVAYWAGIHRRE